MRSVQPYMACITDVECVTPRVTMMSNLARLLHIPPGLRGKKCLEMKLDHRNSYPCLAYIRY